MSNALSFSKKIIQSNKTRIFLSFSPQFTPLHDSASSFMFVPPLLCFSWTTGWCNVTISFHLKQKGTQVRVLWTPRHAALSFHNASVITYSWWHNLHQHTNRIQRQGTRGPSASRASALEEFHVQYRAHKPKNVLRLCLFVFQEWHLLSEEAQKVDQRRQLGSHCGRGETSQISKIESHEKTKQQQNHRDAADGSFGSSPKDVSKTDTGGDRGLGWSSRSCGFHTWGRQQKKCLF